MPDAELSLLVHWANFYVITGSAAAALTGLQFIVIVLGAEMNRASAEANRAFGTPNIVHFCTVLFIAAILSAPWPALVDIAYIVGLCGAAGIVYTGVIIRTVRRQTAYMPVMEDWVWHFTLPPLAYATLLVSAAVFQSAPALALFLVAGTVLLLLFIGIHNSWDSVTFIALQQRHQQESEKTSQSE